MTDKIEFYFDFGSPTAYLAYGELKKLSEKYDVSIIYEPILLGAVHKATNNIPPGSVPAKGAYMLKYDMPRYVELYGVPFKMNPAFPINTLSIMRGCYAAKKMNVFAQYIEVMFDAMWVKGSDLGNQSLLKKTLNDSGIDADQFLELISSEEIKEELKDNTAKAIKRGCFGAPTMYHNNEMYFGQDRIFFIEKKLS